VKKNLIITFLLLFSSLLVTAQVIKSPPDSLIKVLPVGEGRHTSYLYTIGGKLQTREDVIVRLMAYAPSAGEYKQARNNITWTYISAGGFVGSSTSAIIEFKNNNKNAGATTGFVNGNAAIIHQKHNLTGAHVFTGAATGFLFSSIFHLVRASIHSEKSIELYNQQFE
jgi:hypothetical protein